MRLTRVFVDEPLDGVAEVTLRGAVARHVGTVLRLQAGDSLCVFDGRGGEYSATVREVRKASVRVALGAFTAEGPPPPLEIVLWQGISRRERMDFTVQKATELGVALIVPVITRRCVVRPEGERAARRLRHWQALVASAAEQCGRTRLPRVLEPAPLREHLATPPGDGLRVLLDPGAPAALAALGRAPVERLTVLAGPEGGLDVAELEAAMGAGFRAVSLGPRVLRTETAAIVALSISQSLWGDLR